MTYRIPLLATALALLSTTATAHIGDIKATVEAVKPSEMILAQPLLQIETIQVAEGAICGLAPHLSDLAFDLTGGQSTAPEVLACLAE